MHSWQAYSEYARVICWVNELFHSRLHRNDILVRASGMVDFLILVSVTVLGHTEPGRHPGIPCPYQAAMVEKEPTSSERKGSDFGLSGYCRSENEDAERFSCLWRPQASGKTQGNVTRGLCALLRKPYGVGHSDARFPDEIAEARLCGLN